MKPESHKKTSLKAYEERRKKRKKEKRSNPSRLNDRCKELSLGSSGIDKGSGSPKRITQLKIGLRQLTGYAKINTTNEGGKCPSWAPEATRKVGSLRVTIHDASER